MVGLAGADSGRRLPATLILLLLLRTATADTPGSRLQALVEQVAENELQAKAEGISPDTWKDGYLKMGDESSNTILKTRTQDDRAIGALARLLSRPILPELFSPSSYNELADGEPELTNRRAQEAVFPSPLSPAGREKHPATVPLPAKKQKCCGNPPETKVSFHLNTGDKR